MTCPALAGGLDPSSGVIVTGWRTQLAPFSGDGNRKRAEVRMEREPVDVMSSITR